MLLKASQQISHRRVSDQSHRGSNCQLAFHCQPVFAVECLKDLQRFLRQDNEVERPAFFALCTTNVAKSDLVPLLATYPDNHEIVFNAGSTLPAMATLNSILVDRPFLFRPCKARICYGNTKENNEQIIDLAAKI